MENLARDLSEEIILIDPSPRRPHTDLAPRYRDYYNGTHFITLSSTSQLPQYESFNRKRPLDPLSAQHEASAPKRRNICSSTSSRLSSTSSGGCILKSPFYWKVDTQSPGDASSSSESPINKPSAQQIAGLHTEISQEDRNLMLFTYAWVADGEEDAAEEKETTVDEYELAYFRLKKPRKKRIPKETLPRPWENLKDLDTMIYLDIAVGEDVGEVVIDSWTTNLDGDS